MTRCTVCAKRELNLVRAEADLYRAKGLLQRHGDKYDGRYIRQVSAAKRNVDLAEGVLADHVEQDHGGVKPEADHSIFDRVHVPKPVEIPEGKAKCLACGKAVSVVGGTRLRRHTMPDREACPNVQLGEGKVLTGPTPEVKISRLSARRPQGRARRGRSEPSRLDAGTNCRDCGKWLPGERILCGRCSVLRGAAS